LQILRSMSRAERILAIVDAGLLLTLLVLLGELIFRFNWDSFVPDSLVALLTGIVVGVILSLNQNRIERDRKRRDAAVAWSILRPRVAGAMVRELALREYLDATGFTEYVEPVVELATMLSDYPLAVWVKDIDDSELSYLNFLLVESYGIEDLASRTDAMIRREAARALGQAQNSEDVRVVALFAFRMLLREQHPDNPPSGLAAETIDRFTSIAMDLNRRTAAERQPFMEKLMAIATYWRQARRTLYPTNDVVATRETFLELSARTSKG